jgi:hypothetical protein
MLGTVLSLVGINLKRQVRQLVLTVVFALLGAILLLLALGFGIAAIYEWLKFEYGTLPALGILGSTWAVLGIVALCLAFLRPKGTKRAAAVPAANLQDPAAAIAQATEQAVHGATGLVREGSRKQVFGAVLIAALAGFLIGRRL